MTTVEPDDEWLHSFYYFNEEIPTTEKFEETMADYLSFEIDMVLHGREYLFNENDNKNELVDIEENEKSNQETGEFFD